MQVSDKLIKPLTEAKYLNADNVSRYRCIMRIFFEHYEFKGYICRVKNEDFMKPFFELYANKNKTITQGLITFRQQKSVRSKTYTY